MQTVTEPLPVTPLVALVLRHLGFWHDPPPKPPLHRLPGFWRVGPEGDFRGRSGNRK
jgi:hypothetical protein